MNKICIALAVVFLCTSAVSIQKPHLNNHIREKEWFDPQDLPCAFQLFANSTSTVVETGERAGETTAVFARHGTYFRSHTKYMLEGTEKLDKNILIRSDLVENNKMAFFDAELKDVDGSCNIDWKTEDEVKAYIENDQLKVFYHMQVFDKKEEGQYQGKKYTVYSLQDENHTLKYYADEHDRLYVIEETYAYNGTNLHLHDITTFDYVLNVSLSAFVIDKTISSNCSEEAYNAPTDLVCPLYFVQKTLPCAFQAKIDDTSTVLESGVVEKNDAFLAVQGNCSKLHCVTSRTGRKQRTNEIVFRSDLKNEAGEIKAFGGEFGKECNEVMASPIDIIFFAYYYLVLIPRPYQKIESGEFQGKKCRVYKYKEGVETSESYVDDDGYIIGVSDVSWNIDDSGRKELVKTDRSIEYNFVSPSLKEFVAADSYTSKCSKECYKPPTHDQCEGSSMVAVNVVFVFLVVLFVSLL